MVGQIFRMIFFGALRQAEIEHVNEKLFSTVIDTLFMMTIFRDELNSRFVVTFTVLVFWKIFHWISADRVDYLEQAPQSRWAYFRLFFLMLILLLADVGFSLYAAYTYSLKGPTMTMLFGFEYSLLAIMNVTTMTKFFFHIYDVRREGRWDNKSVAVMYLEFFSDFVRMLVYLAFFALILKYFGIPLHIIRQLYLTVMSFWKRVTDILRYRKATQNMDQRFPDVTAQELAANEAICVVCRDQMTSGKRLPCGHILHFNCLRSWLERQQRCPICNASVFFEEHQPNAAAGVGVIPPVAGVPPFVPGLPHQMGANQIWGGVVAAGAPAAEGVEGHLPPPYMMVVDPHIEERFQFLQQQITVLQEQVDSLETQLKELRENSSVVSEKKTITSSEKDQTTIHNNNNNDDDDNTPDAIRKRRLQFFESK
eukprot:TRINITY_DN3466_c0_g1_i2.p1 TRINITY_DN3466_c0_g1~~TRINITY_DN3466_c0_g1_i2.p1  ORF type:complete len:492 (+),score=109.35 TRINITY_DN3466_c0_g1_i2:205-1476(+)